MFFPWKRPAPPTSTRDAATPFSPLSPAPTAPSTIGEAHAQTHTLEKIVGLMGDIGARLTALEMKRAQQRQLAAQQQIVPPRPPTTQPDHQPMPTQDHAPCACQHVLMPQKTKDGVNVMLRNPSLAPRAHITFDPVSRSHATRDQNNFGEKPPGRFTSAEADRMARHIVGAGPPSAKELNDSYAKYWQRDANGGGVKTSAQNVNQRGDMVEAVSSDPSERFIGSGPSTQYRDDDVRPSPAALGELNRQFARAKTQGQRDAITDAWKSYMSAPRDAASMASQWKPKQPAISPQAPKASDTTDAPWSNLYEQNKSTIGGDPNKIQVGQSLNLPGGGTHTVRSGETLSSIAATPSGTDLGSKSLSAERGGMESTPAPSGSYSSGGSLSSSEGAPAGAPGAHNAANVPVPPTKPSDLSSAPSGGNSETGMGGAKGGPTTLLGGGGEASGGNYSSNASLKTGEGWPAGSSSAYPTGGAPSGGSGEGLKPLASEGGSGGTTSDRKPRPRGRR
jgi:LysM repeat protein